MIAGLVAERTMELAQTNAHMLQESASVRRRSEICALLDPRGRHRHRPEGRARLPLSIGKRSNFSAIRVMNSWGNPSRS